MENKKQILPNQLCLTAEKDFALSEEIIELIGDYLYDKYGCYANSFDYKVEIAKIKWDTAN